MAIALRLPDTQPAPDAFCLISDLVNVVR